MVVPPSGSAGVSRVGNIIDLQAENVIGFDRLDTLTFEVVVVAESVTGDG